MMPQYCAVEFQFDSWVQVSVESAEVGRVDEIVHEKHRFLIYVMKWNREITETSNILENIKKQYRL